jgi:hypothetical protein
MHSGSQEPLCVSCIQQGKHEKGRVTMVTIEKVENFLWKFFGESHIVTSPAGTFNVQDLGPALADFLHEHGVTIDWSDGSRFGGTL